MATTTISGSGTRNNKGTVFGGGNIAGSRFRSLSVVTNATGPVNMFTTSYPSYRTGIESILKGSAVTITAITQSSSSGYVNIAKTSHGLSLGDLIVVYGTNVTGYNTIHRVTVVTDANNVRTDVTYTANTTTHGSYKAFSGNVGKMVTRQYVGKIIGSYVAGTANSTLRIPGSHFVRHSIPVGRGNRRYHITSWNAVTGAATKGANAGDAVYYHDIANNNDNLQAEVLPTRAVPGELVYDSGNRSGPTTADYSQKNG